MHDQVRPQVSPRGEHASDGLQPGRGQPAAAGHQTLQRAGDRLLPPGADTPPAPQPRADRPEWLLGARAATRYDGNRHPASFDQGHMIRPQYAAGALPRARLFMVAGLLIGGSVWRRSPALHRGLAALALLDASKDVAADFGSLYPMQDWRHRAAEVDRLRQADPGPCTSRARASVFAARWAGCGRRSTPGQHVSGSRSNNTRGLNAFHYVRLFQRLGLLRTDAAPYRLGAPGTASH